MSRDQNRERRRTAPKEPELMHEAGRGKHDRMRNRKKSQSIISKLYSHRAAITSKKNKKCVLKQKISIENGRDKNTSL